MHPVKESCARLLAAADQQDLAAAEEAIAELSAAIAGLPAIDPARDLARHQAALETVQAACRWIESLKYQINLESSHVAQVQRVFVRTLRVLPDNRIDCRG